MDWLNYHHLLYFWTVVTEGSVVRAARKLRLAQPTVSGQVKLLEDALGERLFQRTGRTLVLTEMGRLVFRYADDIFALGRELQDAVKGRKAPQRLVVGVADVVPKLIARRLLAPALDVSGSLRIVVREDTSEKLLAALALFELDVVLSDAPVPPNARVKAFSHALGECGVSFFAAAKDAARLKRGFPRTLDGLAFLLPAAGTAIRRDLERWFDVNGLNPAIVGEFDDSALLKTFGEAGLGVFAAPSVIDADVTRQYRVRVIGRTEDVRERFYAISIERRLTHPAVVAITEAARRKVFG